MVYGHFPRPVQPQLAFVLMKECLKSLIRKGEGKSGHTIMADVWGNGELIYGTSSKKLKETAYESWLPGRK